MVGLPPKGETVSLPPFLPDERMFTSSFMGSTRLIIDIPKLVTLYQTGRLKLDELITNWYARALEHINEAIESTDKGEALRSVIIF